MSDAIILETPERIGMTPTHEGMVADVPHQFYVLNRPAG